MGGREEGKRKIGEDGRMEEEKREKRRDRITSRSKRKWKRK